MIKTLLLVLSSLSYSMFLITAQYEEQPYDFCKNGLLDMCDFNLVYFLQMSVFHMIFFAVVSTSIFFMIKVSIKMIFYFSKKLKGF